MPKINQLPVANSISNSTLIPVYNNSTTEKVTLSQIASYVGNVNTSGYATETYVNNAISNLVDGAPGALNTLNEIAAAISDDSSFAGSITASLALKANASDLGNITFNLQTITTSVTGGDVTVQAANHGAGAGGDVNLTAGTGTGNNGVVKINTAGIYTWIFDNGGNTTFPGDISFDSAVGDLTGSVIGDLRGSVFGDDSTIIVDGVNSKIKADVETATDWTVDVEGETWTFDNLGSLTFPGGNTISTASGFKISPSNGSVLTLGTPAYEWRFDDSNGKLFLPIKDSTDTGDLELRGGGIYQIADEDLIIRARDADDDDFSVYLQVDDGTGSVFSETRLRRNRFSVNIDKGGANHNWSFDDTGWFELAGDIRTAYGVNTSIYLPGAGASNTLTLKTVDNTDTLKANVTVGSANVTISTANAAHTWNFDDTGRFTAPGDVYGQYFTVRGGGAAGTEIGSLGFAGNIITVFGTEGVNIETVGEGGPQWQFSTTGDLTIPGDIRSENDINIDINLSDSTLYTWTFTQGGEFVIPGKITSNNTITIDNRASGDPYDIQIYSADDILLQARDLTTPGPTEGGDVNINAGDGGPDDNIDGPGGGGDVRLFGGVGGTGNTIIAGTGGVVALSAGDGGEGSATAQSGSGGDLILRAGDGGTPNGGGGNEGGDIYITAGATTNAETNRGSIILTSGDGGDETTNGGYVEINIPAEGTNPGGTWIFTSAGNVLEVPADAEIFCPNAGGINVVTANNPTNIKVINTSTTTTHTWAFDDDGSLTFPDSTVQTTAYTPYTFSVAADDSTERTINNDELVKFVGAGTVTTSSDSEGTITITSSLSPTLNVLKIDDGVHEKFQELADATGTVTHDCSAGHIFYHASPDANWTVNLTNLNLSEGYATTVTIIIDQGGTGYYPNALQVGGSAQTINWQGNTTPTPSTNRQDVVSFSILAFSGGYTVLGQLTGF